MFSARGKVAVLMDGLLRLSHLLVPDLELLKLLCQHGQAPVEQRPPVA